LTRRAISNTKRSVSILPAIAAEVMKRLVAPSVKPRLIPPIVTNATPNPAPLLTPKIYGPARGLRKRVCIINPLTDNAIPAMMAVSIFGKRMVRSICRSISASSPIGYSQRLPTQISRHAKSKRSKDNEIKMTVVLFTATKVQLFVESLQKIVRT